MIGSFFNKVSSLFSADLAMDLGTANTLIYTRDKGIVLDEPSVVAVGTKSRHVEAVGLEAKQMYGRTHSRVETIRPMKDGVIADFDITNTMINYFIKKVLKNQRFFKPKMVVGIPTCITQVEKKSGDRRFLDGRRAGGAPGRGTHGRRDRGRHPGAQARRQHGDRHRRRHNRRGGGVPFGHRLTASPCAWRETRSTRPSCATCGSATTSTSACLKGSG